MTFPNFKQIQIFGYKNKQSIEIGALDNIGQLLNEAEANIKKREFKSTQVKEMFAYGLKEISKTLFSNKEDLYGLTAYVVFPFKTNPERRNINDPYFVELLLDCVAVISFLGMEHEFSEEFTNFRIDKKRFYGIYYTTGTNSLKDKFIELLRELQKNDVLLPPNFKFLILSSTQEKQLEEAKMHKVVQDICGHSDYIKPARLGIAKCISPTSYLINEADSIEDARKYLRGLLDVG